MKRAEDARAAATETSRLIREATSFFCKLGWREVWSRSAMSLVTSDDREQLSKCVQNFERLLKTGKASWKPTYKRFVRSLPFPFRIYVARAFNSPPARVTIPSSGFSGATNQIWRPDFGKLRPCCPCLVCGGLATPHGLWEGGLATWVRPGAPKTVILRPLTCSPRKESGPVVRRKCSTIMNGKEASGTCGCALWCSL